MKIVITADNHLDHLYGGEKLIDMFVGKIKAHNPDVVVNLGDMTSGRLGQKHNGLVKILGDPSTLYVFGNHDLWSKKSQKNRTPTAAMEFMVNELREFPATPLETSFQDLSSLWKKEDHIVIGTMGFPDFLHPAFVMPREYYNKRYPTNDGKYLDLSKGWIFYSNMLIASFSRRIEKALTSGAKNIIVATHYPIFDGQASPSGDLISAYFFCHSVGQMVKIAAKQNPDIKFWCFAGHSHDYCRGIPVTEENVFSYGLQAEYGRLVFATIDTELGFEQEVKTEWTKEMPRWATGFNGPIIETVESKLT